MTPRRPRSKRGGNPVPVREFWRQERDPQYDADLARDPEAAAWLARFDQELAHGTRWRRVGEPRVHTPDELRKLDAERVARRRNPDVLSTPAYRGPALEDIAEAGGDPDAFIVRHTGGVRPGAAEDAVIDAIDHARALSRRREVVVTPECVCGKCTRAELRVFGRCPRHTSEDA